MNDFWKELKSWYADKGISTEPFFHDTSTELGRDEMLMDFASRQLQIHKDEKISQREITHQLNQDRELLEEKKITVAQIREREGLPIDPSLIDAEHYNNGFRICPECEGNPPHRNVLSRSWRIPCKTCGRSS